MNSNDEVIVRFYEGFAAADAEVNEIDATFRFEDGLIVDHRDSFDLWKWSRMALGLPGLLLGWSPVVQGKIRRQSAALLASSD